MRRKKRAISLVFTLIAVVAACSSSPTTTDLGHPIYTAPFTVIGAPHTLRWIDNSHVAYSGEGKLAIWDIDRNTMVEIPDRSLQCVDASGPEPVLLTEGVAKVPARGDPPEGDPKTAMVNPVYLGPLGREERLGPDQERTILSPARPHLLASGETIKQWFVRDNFTSCRGRWLPDETTSPHLARLAPRLFGGTMAFERGRKETESMLLYRADRPEPIKLPVRECDIGGGWSDLTYFVFKNAYLAFGEHGFDSESGKCESLPSPNKPLRYWWLHRDGRVEEGALPSKWDAYALAKQLSPGQTFVQNLGGINFYYPTKVGFIFSVLFSERSGAARHALFIEDGDKWRLLYQAPRISNALKPSPNGCRVSFGEGQAGDRFGFNPTPQALKVIDLCATLSDSLPARRP